MISRGLAMGRADPLDAGSYSMTGTKLTVFEHCALDNNGQINLVLRCIADMFDQASESHTINLHSWLLVICGGLVFFMQAGFAMLCAGCVRKKNVQNTMLKNMLDACGAAVAFYTCGYAFAFSAPRNSDDEISFIGAHHFVGMGQATIDPAFWFYQFAFSATAVTIVAGTLAERCQMASYLLYSLFLTGFVYPVAARSIWSPYGFLSMSRTNPIGDMGVLDFAGCGVVHVTGGMTALIAGYLLGPRKGRFFDAKGRPLVRPREFPGHSIALQLLGCMILWYGWYGFNCGSALLLSTNINTGQVGALAAVNTSLAASSGAISALFTNLYLEERRTGDYSFSLTMSMNGLLSGCVAITASVGTVEPWAACMIGMIAGWVYMASTSLLLKCKIDDAVDAIPVHLGSGTWGLLAAGLFASPRRLKDCFGSGVPHVGWLYSLGEGSLDAQLLANQVAGWLFLVGWVMCTMVPFFLWLNYMGWLRADSLEELIGLDMTYHGAPKPSKTNPKNAVSRHSTMENEEDEDQQQQQEQEEDEHEEEEALEAYEQRKRAKGIETPP